MKALFLLFLLTSMVACELPRDPKDSLKLLKQNIPFRVGIVLAPGYAEKNGNSFSGSEVDIVKTYATHIDTDIQFKEYSVEEGFKSLEEGEIHLLLGGFYESIPFRNAGFTRPYNSKKNVFAILRGENAFLVSFEKFLKETRDESR